MNCVRATQTVEETIKKSRFIGVIIPCENETELVKAFNQLQAHYPDASHIAFAFKLLAPDGTIVSRFHDAGEPSGTAGKPIFNHLEGNDLINCLIAVIRYYGGIKLGAGGLTRAYGNSARQVINASRVSPFVEYQNLHLTIDYKKRQQLEYQLKKIDGKIIEQAFSDRLDLIVRVPQEELDSLAAQFAERGG